MDNALNCGWLLRKQTLQQSVLLSVAVNNKQSNANKKYLHS